MNLPFLFLFTVLLFSCSTRNETTETHTPLQAEILDLSEKNIDIDYLVIAPEPLLNAGKKLCSFHNINTDDDVKEAAVVSLCSIMELYPGDTISALTSFLSSDTHKWNSLPKYVVLLGDEKLNSGEAGIPVFKVPKGESNPFEYYDNIYLDPDKDTIIDYIVARIPIRSEKEMDLYLFKMGTYKRNSKESVFFTVDNSKRPSFPEWMKCNGYVYDVPEEFPINSKSRSTWFEINFSEYSAHMSTIIESIGWKNNTFYIDDFIIDYDSLLKDVNDSSLMVSKGENFFFDNRAAARNDFYNKANQNHKLQVHLGHAAPEQFTVENIYSFKDTSLFTTPSVFLHLGCYSAEFTSDSSMTRKLMFSSRGGPVAFLGCPYANYATPGSTYINSFLSDFSENTDATVGDLFLQERNRTSEKRYFILLGDPALRI